MTHFDHVYLVLILVFVGMLIKVVRDGLRDVGLIKLEISTTQGACEQAIQDAEATQQELENLNAKAAGLTEEIGTLEQQDRTLTKDIESLQDKLEGKSRAQRSAALSRLGE